MLKLRVIQAKFGDCLIVEYGSSDNPKYMLIDGGPGGVYKSYLRDELLSIKESGGQLELMVLSHIDGDHIVGLIQFTEELKEQQADEVEPVIEVKQLWMNSFSQSIGKNNKITQGLNTLNSKVQHVLSTMPETERAFLSIPQGNTLHRNALLLNIPVNSTANYGTISCDTLPQPVQMENLKITIIGPNEANLNQLEEEWKAWIVENENKIMMSDPEILAYIDRSVPNLSSIMFLMEAEGKSVLFTGDGRGDFILEGLEYRKLLDEEGRIHVNIFKVPHHGSIRNASETFFLKVTADKYVISGDGHHGNPDYETLKHIVEAAAKQNRKVELVCTNETESTKKLTVSFPPKNYPYTLTYLPKDKSSLSLNLLD